MSKLLSPEKILKTYNYSELFGSNEAEAKKTFREYCKLYHPDSDDSEKAQKIFNHIMMIYNSNGKSFVTDGINTISIEFRDKTTNKGFVLNNPSEHNTELCKVYYTTTKVALVYDTKYKKFYDNYISSVKNLHYADKEMEKNFSRYFPDIIKTFETSDNKYIILLNKTSEVLPLKIVLDAYKNMGQNIPERQAAWMMNRLYNLACYFEYNDLAFNGFSLNNIWVSPEMHSLLVFTGFEYTKPLNTKMIGLPADVYSIIPLKVKTTKESVTITDLESINQLGRIIFNNNVNTENINKFLNKGISDDKTPLDLWKEYKVEMKKHFPKKEFVIWDNIPLNNKNK